MASPPRIGLSLCAGGGGLDMGLGLAEPGFATAAYVEWEEYPRRTLIAGQRAGYLHTAPIWDNVKTCSGRPWRGIVDTVLAGYPCQPFSKAGRRLGAKDPRHLWPDVARIIDECQPEWVFLENVSGHITLGLDAVLRQLWEMGWSPAAGAFSAAETGAPHERLRVFIVAHRNSRIAGADRRQSDAGPDRLDNTGRGCGKAMADDCRGRCGGSGSGQVQQPRRTETVGPGDCMGHPAGIGCGEGRAEPVIWIGRGAAPIAGRAMADASGAGPQGQQRGQCHPGEWKNAHGFAGSSRGTGVFPPGPSDAAAWADTLAVAPDLAPAAGLADCLAWAGRLAAALERAEQAALEPLVRRMADGLASRPRALRLLGNGVHPLAAAHAWRTLAAAHGLGAVDMDAAGGDEADGSNEFVLRKDTP